MKICIFKAKLKISYRKLKIFVNKLKSKNIAEIYLNLLVTKSTKNSKIFLNVLNTLFFNYKSFNIKLKEIIVNKDITLKRHQPRAKGRAFKIEKKFSKLNFIFVLSNVPSFSQEKKYLKQNFIKNKNLSLNIKELSALNTLYLNYKY